MPTDSASPALPPAASKSAPRARSLWPLVGLGLVLSMVLGALATVARELVTRPPPLPVLVTLPPFTLTNQEGVPFGSRPLAGQAYVADFIFSRCPTICPRITERMKTLEKHTGPRLKLVSFTVDPAFDTPERLKAYAGKHHADLARWSFLTGSVEGMKSTIVQGFKISVGKEGPDDDFLSIFHGSQLVLVDGQGRVRGYYDSADDEAMKRLEKDADALAVSPMSSPPAA